MKKIGVVMLMVLLFAMQISAKTITGIVSEYQGNPLPGVSVLVKGSANGVVTDFDGRFTIETKEGSVLVFAYIGFMKQELKVGKSNTMNVYLKADNIALEEVVTIGYGTQKKKEITGAVNVIVSEDLERIPTSDIKSALQGKIAGVALNNGKRILIRGYNSIYEKEIDESYATIVENEYKSVLKDPLSTFSIDVDAASYSNVRRMIQNGQKPPTDAVRIEEMINYFDYNYSQPKNDDPFSINYELASCPWNNQNKILHIGLQGKKLNVKEAPASNLVFLIDVSGSMSSSNKLPLLKKSFSLLVNQMRKKDKVAIVVYAGSSGLVLPSTSGAEKKKILKALKKLHSGGSTAGAAGLKLAYNVAEENFIKGGNNRIILATDGDFNVGQSSDSDLEKLIVSKRNKGIFMSVMGFGTGNYKDSKMEIIADKGNGNYAYIDNLMEAKKVFINEFSSTLFTIAKDVKIQIEFNPNLVKEYRLIGYENRLLKNRDFSNDKKDAGELGAGHTVTALYEIVPVGVRSEQDLKYQKKIKVKTDFSTELATVKFRYKKPNATKSKLMIKTIKGKAVSFDNTSDNFKFSTAVAGFGMLLKNSDYSGTLSYKEVLKIAKSGKSADEKGYRSEFIRLVDLARHL